MRITSSHNKITVALPKESDTKLFSQKKLNAIVQNAIAEKKSLLEDCAVRFQKTPEEIRKVVASIRIGG